LRKTRKPKKKLPVQTRERAIQVGDRHVFNLASDDVTPIVEFLESFREMVDPRAQSKSKLISMKVPEPLLAAFKFKSRSHGVPYQSMIKKLMMEWLKTNAS
jgi:predicted DNA binding CopG/RHH family protein